MSQAQEARWPRLLQTGCQGWPLSGAREAARPAKRGFWVEPKTAPLDDHCSMNSRAWGNITSVVSFWRYLTPIAAGSEAAVFSHLYFT